MIVKELIERLQKLDPAAPIGIKDGEYVRNINLGPGQIVRHIVSQHDHDNCADLEEYPIGTDIYYMGFGCY